MVLLKAECLSGIVDQVNMDLMKCALRQCLKHCELLAITVCFVNKTKPPNQRFLIPDLCAVLDPTA